MNEVDTRSIRRRINDERISYKTRAWFSLSIAGIIFLLFVFEVFGKVDNTLPIMFILFAISLLLSLYNAVQVEEFYSRASFICPECGSTIKLIDIINIECPFCHHDGKNYKHLFTHCDCGKESRIIDYFCPHCDNTIDLVSPYNKQNLINDRYRKSNG
jgi:hypothetical protein